MMKALSAAFFFVIISSTYALEPVAKPVAAAASAKFSGPGVAPPARATPAVGLPWGPTHQRRLERHYYVQRRSYGDNVGDAFFGMLIGFVLLVVVSPSRDLARRLC